MKLASCGLGEAVVAGKFESEQKRNSGAADRQGGSCHSVGAEAEEAMTDKLDALSGRIKL